MKVKDLILELQKHDQEAEVVVDGYEMGVSDVRKVVATVIFQNENRPYWYGRFETTEPYNYSVKNAKPINAVYLPRLDHEDASCDYDWLEHLPSLRP